MTEPHDKVVARCKRVQENALYTAQAHFEIATEKGTRARVWLVLVPSLASSACGLAVALGCPAWLGAVPALAGAISAVSAFLGIEKEASAHESAGKLLTQLRHDARAVCDRSTEAIPAGFFEAEVLALEHRYGAFVASLPLTNDAAFEKARKKIQSGTFKYDHEGAQPQTPTEPPQLPPPTTPAALPTSAATATAQVTPGKKT